MKAISPVIATLILIAIAVIAGVFVLRQFLTFAGTAGQQDVLAIQDATLIAKHNPGNTMNVTLLINLKNQGDKIVKVKKITVDTKDVFVAAAGEEITIRPGTTYSKTYLVYNGTYTADWEVGTEHIVKVTYDVVGGNADQAITIKVRAT